MGQPRDEMLSFLDGNPNYFDAITEFVTALPKQIESIQTAFDDQALNDLAVQLSTDQQTEPLPEIPDQEVDKIFHELDSLVHQCLTARIAPENQPDAEI